MANFNVTLPGARISPLLDQESGNFGSAVRYLVYGSDLAVPAATGATDTITVTLGTTPKNFAVIAGFIFVSQVFAGPGGLTAQVGVTGALAGIVPALSVQATGIKTQTAGIFAQATSGIASTSLVLTVTSAVSGGPAALTGGVLEIVLQILDLDKIY